MSRALEDQPHQAHPQPTFLSVAAEEMQEVLMVPAQAPVVQVSVVLPVLLMLPVLPVLLVHLCQRQQSLR